MNQTCSLVARFSVVVISMSVVFGLLAVATLAQARAPETTEEADTVVSIEKKFSGPVPAGYTADQFSFQITGTSASGTAVSENVTLIAFTDDTADNTVTLPVGSYTITETGPVDFVLAEWVIQWSGDACVSQTDESTTLTVTPEDVGATNFECRADNQWKPDHDSGDDDDDNGGGDDGDGGGDDGDGGGNGDGGDGGGGDGGDGGDGGGGDGDNTASSTYRIEGYVWHDANENTNWDGFSDDDDNATTSEDELTSWVVQITNGTEEFSTTTDATGFYYFEVPAGTWTIAEVLQDGWKLITPTSGVHVVTVPEAVAQQSVIETLWAYMWPTAHAAVVATFGPFNFGNNQTSSGGGDSSDDGSDSSSSSGGGGGSQRLQCEEFTVRTTAIGDELTWETVGGRQLMITADGVEIFATSDNAEVKNGSYQAVGSTADSFTLTVERGSRSDTCSFQKSDGSGSGSGAPIPQVLGDQTTVVPVGAPLTGHGGAAPQSPMVSLSGLLLLISIATLWWTRRPARS